MNHKLFYALIIFIFIGGAIRFFMDSSYIVGVIFLIVAGLFAMRFSRGGKKYESD